MCYVLSTCKRPISPLLYNKFDLIWFHDDDDVRMVTPKVESSKYGIKILHAVKVIFLKRKVL